MEYIRIRAAVYSLATPPLNPSANTPKAAVPADELAEDEDDDTDDPPWYKFELVELDLLNSK